jgi:hypothetical protein
MYSIKVISSLYHAIKNLIYLHAEDKITSKFTYYKYFLFLFCIFQLYLFFNFSCNFLRITESIF